MGGKRSWEEVVARTAQVLGVTRVCPQTGRHDGHSHRALAGGILLEVQQLHVQGLVSVQGLIYDLQPWGLPWRGLGVQVVLTLWSVDGWFDTGVLSDMRGVQDTGSHCTVVFGET